MIFKNRQEKPSLSVEYVKGDIEGQLTEALIQSISQSGLYEYVRSGGEFTLQVSILSSNSSPIGYEYGSNHQNLFAIENRNTVTVQIELLDSASQEALFAPFTLTTSIEFDYANVDSVRFLSTLYPEGKLNPLIRYSLGQFDSIEGSQEDATNALYQLLAQKITNALLCYL